MKKRIKMLFCKHWFIRMNDTKWFEIYGNAYEQRIRCKKCGHDGPL